MDLFAKESSIDRWLSYKRLCISIATSQHWGEAFYPCAEYTDKDLGGVCGPLHTELSFDKLRGQMCSDWKGSDSSLV